MITNVHFHDQHKIRNNDTAFYSNYWRWNRIACGQTEENQLFYNMIIVNRVICNSSDLKPKKMVTRILRKKITNTIFLTENNGASHKQVNTVPFLAATVTVHRHLYYLNKKMIQVTFTPQKLNL
jgi:hypothetical protein